MNFLDQLNGTTCSTMFIIGDQDPATPLQDSEDMKTRINPAILRYERFDNAGHGVWLDKPSEAFTVIREFITSESKE